MCWIQFRKEQNYFHKKRVECFAPLWNLQNILLECQTHDAFYYNRIIKLKYFKNGKRPFGVHISFRFIKKNNQLRKKLKHPQPKKFCNIPKSERSQARWEVASTFLSKFGPQNGLSFTIDGNWLPLNTSLIKIFTYIAKLKRRQLKVKITQTMKISFVLFLFKVGTVFE